MERCANTEALNRYQNKLEKQEKSFELLLDSLDDDLVEIQEMIDRVIRISRDYDGYDFSEEIRDTLKDMI